MILSPATHLSIRLILGLLATLAVANVASARGELHAVQFSLCQDGGGADCVIDGDTFRLEGRKIRIADIDTPETHGPRCSAEAAMGAKATQRLRALLNAGAFSLHNVERDTDRYGRDLRLVMRDGRSIGASLVAEGLARPWTGSRQPWCRS